MAKKKNVAPVNNEMPTEITKNKIEDVDIDTGNAESSEEMTQFKAFFNEWFLRDTSKKIRNGKKTRAKEGKVMTTYPTYRLQKRPTRP